MAAQTALETLLKRDRLVVLTGLAATTALSWAYLVKMAQDMRAMSLDMSMDLNAPCNLPWTRSDALMMFLMWTVMMIGMMIPTASPMVLVFAAHSRRQREQQQPYVPAGVFLSGYLLVWTGFSLIATVLQWALHQAALLSMMLESTSPVLGATILIAAGVFQLTPLKHACLRHCRSPLAFFMGRWRPGAVGAVRMGLEHGLYCLGCCWILMALLFVGGVMNLLWIATITVFVLIEKAAPGGTIVGRVCGVCLILAGMAVIGFN
ncbi:MAG: DUF2182 domain-containing protein [Candidatus Hydrogenedentes bacterium]|nr:DUF2182 domain-containing protein [Candidatus Hydrogenedentota bacterium]